MLPLRKWFISIVLVATCAIAAVWALTFDHLRYEEAQAVRETEVVSANLAAALEEQALRTLGSVEEALTFVAREYRRLGHAIDLPRLLGESPIEAAAYGTMAIVDPEGALVAQTHDALPTRYLYDRLLAHRADTSGQPLVGRPIQVRAGEDWVIPVSKRIDKADDSIGGVVFAGLNASHFTDFYAQVLTGGAGAMMLVGHDGIVRARYVPTEGASFGQDMRASTLARRLHESPVGSYLSTSADPVETTPRHYSYRVLPRYGMVVLVGSARSDVLRDLTDRKGTNYLVASLATLFTIAAAAALMMLLNRQRGIIDELAHSVTQQKAAQHELMFKNTILATQQDASPDAILLVDDDGRVVSYNRPFAELWDVRPEGLEQRERDPLLQTVSAQVRNPEQFLARVRYLYEHRQEKSHEFVELVDGRTLERYSAPVLTSEGAYLGRVWYFRDVSKVKEYQEKLRHLADHDLLTGLPNRGLFATHTADAMTRARRHGDRFAILFIDLDHFKNVNDSLGHEAGDVLLKQVAQRTQQALRDTDTVARLGGDEFAVLLQRLPEDSAAEAIARKLLAALSLPFHVAAHELFVTASIGVACYPADGKNVEELLRNADAAMYRAKSEGRNSTRLFASELNEHAYEVLTLTNALRHAIERAELALHYQLRYELSTGRISGAEALARWNHPTMGAIPPGRFIPIAENAGFIGEIGLWVLQSACRQMKAWQAAGVAIPRVAVNLSARQFHDPMLIEHITRCVAECGVNASLLELEVTESAMMKDVRGAALTLEQLHAMGISISIDDFGTGYSSLSYLKRFPISHVKIDRSFIAGVPVASDDVGIVRAIVALARTLKLATIAEGVETAEQRGFLRDCGCDEAQGYFFSRPLPPLELEQLIRDEAGRPGLVLLPGGHAV